MVIPGKDWTELTHKQLKDWNVKHTSLTMKKPVHDVWIDDPFPLMQMIFLVVTN